MSPAASLAAGPHVATELAAHAPLRVEALRDRKLPDVFAELRGRASWEYPDRLGEIEHHKLSESATPERADGARTPAGARPRRANS